jgi:hypothetical protein
MRHFFIRSFEILVGFFVILGILGVLATALAVGTGSMTATNGDSISGVFAAIAILFGGLLYITFMAGFMYMGVGIYNNTKRTAEAVERMAGR